MKISDLDFELPEDRIAQQPCARRDGSRLLHVSRARPGVHEDAHFYDLPQWLGPDDVLVRNVTRVVPARLEARKPDTGARCELLLLEEADAGEWWVLCRPARRLKLGTRLALRDGSEVEVRAIGEHGQRKLGFETNDVLDLAHRIGRVPLPPYIRRESTSSDHERYQTVYARDEGSVAAPTAGLHFTPGLLQRLEARGCEILDVSLHVGLGTFAPVQCEDPLQHPMHWERFSLSRHTLQCLETRRANGKRLVAVGTTATRLLESLALWRAGAENDAIEVHEGSAEIRGRTRLFLHPPQAFRWVGALITNFHLPRTTLLLLLDAFLGVSQRKAAYQHALRHDYRFFSYGDAMFIE